MRRTRAILGMIITIAVIALASIQSASTTQQPQEPLALGFVVSDGSLAAGTPNIIETNINGAQYEISIEGIDYFYQDFITVVTPSTHHVEGSDQPLVAAVGSVGGKIVVKLYDLNGNLTYGDFQFAMYQP